MHPIRVLVFARLRELVGRDVVSLELPLPCTVGDVRTTMIEEFPEIEPLLSRSRVAINDEFAPDAAAVTADDEIAIIPPVSGG